MKTALLIDSTIRGKDSRTRKLLEAFADHLSPAYKQDRLILTEEALQPLTGDFFRSRQELLEEGRLDHPRFRYARQFQQADLIVIAAPFWDLSFPALLKIYLENISLDGITFLSTADGLKGNCRAGEMIYLTTRGGFYHDSQDEQASPYLKSLCRMFGIPEFAMVDADGLDVAGYDGEEALNEGICQAAQLAASLC
jgi:FMN-dependent NADH-azoreductase